jgi:heme-degrading monooxygenase HmoA
MIAVLFEVTLAPGGQQRYLDLAAQLRPLLADVDGFISVERFQSLSHPDKLLSLSYWRDEQAVAAWRQLDAHRMAQQAGRGGVFADYRLRVAQVLRDYGMTQRLQVPADSGCYHDSSQP